MWPFKKNPPAPNQTEILSNTDIKIDDETIDLPEGWLDWNTVSLDYKVKYLKNAFLVDSSALAKCVIDLIEFYEEHKNEWGTNIEYLFGKLP